MKTKYRIIKGVYGRYVVQAKRWWLPLWCGADLLVTYTFGTVEDAEQYIKTLKGTNVIKEL